jgi:hypothetical protein
MRSAAEVSLAWTQREYLSCGHPVLWPGRPLTFAVSVPGVDDMGFVFVLGAAGRPALEPARCGTLRPQPAGRFKEQKLLHGKGLVMVW